jgi:hypothetical protein
LLRHYDKAIETCKKSLSIRPNPGAALRLAATYSESGSDMMAKAVAGQIQKNAPQLSLAVVQQRLFYKEPAEVERLLAALRKAGLQ